MEKYWHSVTLEKDFCNGCTHCLDRCPTEAIRIVDGKAKIINERCIDCGECLKVCPYKAKGAQSDSLEALDNYKYNIALPAISLYGQFSLHYDLNRVLNTFLKLGFDKVFDVGYAAEIITHHQKEMINENQDQNELFISTYCPAITRLIQIKYPTLIDNIIKLESPMEVAARIVKKEVLNTTDYKPEEIGIFYITQCPAKITSIKEPIGLEESYIDGAISIKSIYSKILKVYDDTDNKEQILKSSYKGFNWGRVGGQSFAMDIDNYMAVDGIDEVIKVLDEIELGKLDNVDFFEGYACVTGCVGGPLNVENPFIAKNNIRKLTQVNPEAQAINYSEFPRDMLVWDKEIKPSNVLKLDQDFQSALEKMTKIEEIFQKLPKINCGACGAPTCRALAEDIVNGTAKIEDCVVLMHQKEVEKNEG